jgi:hypothetical protein
MSHIHPCLHEKGLAGKVGCVFEWAVGTGGWPQGSSCALACTSWGQRVTRGGKEVATLVAVWKGAVSQ